MGVLITAGVLSGWPAVWRGVIALKNRNIDMNVLMTVAVTGAFAIGEWTEAATAAFLFGIAELLEAYSMLRARRSISTLLDNAPKMAALRRNGEVIEVPVGEVIVGDILLVKPGGKLAADGEITTGECELDQAAVTGESVPVFRSSGDTVFAGTINTNGYIEVEVTHAAADSTISRIVEMVESARASQAPSHRFIDKFAKYYTPIVVGFAVLMVTIPVLFMGGELLSWLRRGLVVLVIACPCALVISTPVALVSGLARAARDGLLIKGGKYLEALARVKAVAFDKTGTITEGKLAVIDFISLNGQREENIARAAAIEAKSEHPIAAAIILYAQNEGMGIPPSDDFSILVGKGARAVVAGKKQWVGNHQYCHESGYCSLELERELESYERQGNTVVLVGDGDEAKGFFIIADTIRPSAGSAVGDFRQIGIEHTVLLTGDNVNTAAAIAGASGIAEYRAELLPEDKVKAVETLRMEYGNTLMVGDGVNDAPALAAASVGIAMGAAGSDVALESAPAALMGHDLRAIPRGIKLSRKVRAIIIQNVVFALASKAVVFALAAAGLATLWMAVAADVGVSVVVIINSLRALRKIS
jgi:Cd2+/Zn2+-exporting ATPase